MAPETALVDTSEVDNDPETVSSKGDSTSRKEILGCIDCNLEFSTSFAYCEHMRDQHDNSKPFTCDKCNKAFMHKCTLNRHKISCENKQTFVCHVCGKGFHRKDYLQEHLKGEHKRKMGVIFKCKICGETFQFKSWLLAHKETCKDVFGSIPVKEKKVKKKSLVDRERSGATADDHTSESNMGSHCTDCSQQFKSRLQFNDHMREVHGNLQPYSCQKCQKSFSQLSSLNRHKDGCENKRKVFCEVCGRGFHRLDYLKEHMKGKHKKAKSTYFCRGCGEEFQFKSWLLTHKTTCPGLVQAMAEKVVAQLHEENTAVATASVVQYEESTSAATASIMQFIDSTAAATAGVVQYAVKTEIIVPKEEADFE